MTTIACLKYRWQLMLGGMMLLFCAGHAWGQNQDRVTLQSLSFADLPGEQFEVRMEFDGTAPEPGGFVLEDPPRISIDLPGTRSALGQREFPVSAGNTESLIVLETADRTRLVFNLRQGATYETIREGNAMVVRLTGQSADTEAVGEPGMASVVQTGEEARDPSAAMEARILEVDFRSGDVSGEGVLTLELSGEATVTRAERSGMRVEALLRDVVVPDRLNRRFDVTDFATPVRSVDVLPDNGNAMVVVQMEDDYDYVAWQEGRYYNIAVSPVRTRTGRDAAEQYSDVMMSLNYQEIAVRSVLQLLADEIDFNLVVSDAVSGTVTLHLDDVPWDQALDLVLRSRSLDKRMVGNVLYVAPAAEIASQQQLALEANRQAEALAPLHTEYIQVNYADASNILSLLTGSETGTVAGLPPPDVTEGQEGEAMAFARPQGILSARGSATVDPRTNIIIIRDVASKLEEVRELLARLDVPVRQVLIEARIVNVSTDFGRDLGVRWGVASRARGDNGFHYGGSLDGNVAQLNASDGSLSENFPEALAVDLGADTEDASSFAIGFARNSNLIELELSALESTGNGEVIARPKVTTQDKVMANIESGMRIPYQSQAGGTAGGTTTEFVDAVLSMEVTPQITPDGRIIMELTITQDSVAAGTGQVPAINTNSINTSVLVDNGDTVVLGGIFRDETTTTESKTPLLGDVPYLGRLFKRTSTDRRRTELLIFITPRVIAEFGVR